MANYDNLTAVQQAEFDRLMTVPTNTWPEALMRSAVTLSPMRSQDG